MEQHVPLANKAGIELEIAQAVGIRVGTVHYDQADLAVADPNAHDRERLL